MKNLGWRIGLILLCIALSIFFIYPPEQRIKLGRDLQGGISLIYAVRIPDGELNPEAVLAQVISVLKDRINPQGVFDIAFQPMGRDRIEITMPLPNEKVQGLRRTYREALEELEQQSYVDPIELSVALSEGTAVERYGGTGGERADRFRELQDAFNERGEASKALQAAKLAGLREDAQLGPLEQALADADLAFEAARDRALRISLDRGRISNVLALSDEPQIDKKTREPIEGSSPRRQAITALQTEFSGLNFQPVVTAYDAYIAARTGFDDPDDLIRLLRGAGVLEFYIAARNNDPAKPVNVDDLRQQLAERGADNTDSAQARWFPINDLRQWYDASKPEQLGELQSDPVLFFATRHNLVAASRDGRYYLLLYTSPARSITHRDGDQWAVIGSGTTQDDLGRPAVSFQLDQAGGQKMGQLTAQNIDQPMAIVLDGQVYTAPNINSRIGNRGIIQGNFGQAELNYLIRVLAAGALEARLDPDPIAINTLGPSLGADNLIRGSKAAVISVVLTAAIMLTYYFFAGLIAVIALLANALMTFGLMAMVQGTFTLPGLAGIALSTSMAVDANVLIYERIREEMVNNKENLRNAIRLGYQRALRAIIDGNMTHLIVCVVLLYMATTEVKGFALTMIMGVVATLFTAIFVTRVMYTLYTDVFKFKTLAMLPIVFPSIHRALQPHVDWIRLRPIFLSISAVAVIASIALLVHRGSSLLDTEFRGGVAATMRTRADVSLSRAEVQKAIHELGEKAGSGNPVLYELRNASVLTLGESTVRDGQVYSSQFQIKVASPKEIGAEDIVTDEIVNAIVARFANELDAVQPLSFKGAGSDEYFDYAFPIINDSLGEVIGDARFTQSVREFSGGVAIVVRNINPPASVEDLTERIRIMRGQPDFNNESNRTFKVIGLDPVNPADPAAGFQSAAVVVLDPGASYHKVDADTFERKMEQREWMLVSQALQRRTGLEQVSSFSSAVAETLGAKAIVAVLLCLIGMLAYIWLRFGSLRYSLATVAALAHNVIISLGALALTHALAGTVFASWIRLDEFRLDLNVLAALLTIIGYSINDTIVILDRVRENRGKRLFATPQIVNDSINQTFSRTVLTGGSTILASIVLYWTGGPGLQPFAFTFFVGLIVGTYSSVVIAAPLVVGREKEPAAPANPRSGSPSLPAAVPA